MRGRRTFLKAAEGALDGTPEKVFLEVRRYLEEGKKHPGGFVLMPACEFSPNTRRKTWTPWRIVCSCKGIIGGWIKPNEVAPSGTGIEGWRVENRNMDQIFEKEANQD